MQSPAAQRAVHFVGICGPSASGKSTMAKHLVESLRSPVHALCADWYFFKPHQFAACRKHPRCWEQASSVDTEGLVRDLRELSTTLSSAPPGPVPDIAFGHSAHGVHGISKNRPRTITRSGGAAAGVTLTQDPAVVVSMLPWNPRARRAPSP